jgi:hypothetical protein
MVKAAVNFDPDLEWTEHYVRYGFGVVRQVVGHDFCGELLQDVRRLVGDERPLNDWTVAAPGQKYAVAYCGQYPAFDRLFEHPALDLHLSQLFGRSGYVYQSTAATDPNRRRLAIWVNPYDPDGRPRISRFGHIDSGTPYRGLSFQLCLADTEPYSGNTALFSGTHAVAHQAVLRRPDLADRPGALLSEIRTDAAPFEFVANAGDVVFVHHSLVHSGNPSHSKSRLPRIVLRAEVFPRIPLTYLNPHDPENSAWKRSFPVAEPTEIPLALRWPAVMPEPST